MILRDDETVAGLHCAISTIKHENEALRTVLESLYRQRDDDEENRNRSVITLTSLEDEQAHLKRLIHDEHQNHDQACPHPPNLHSHKQLATTSSSSSSPLLPIFGSPSPLLPPPISSLSLLKQQQELTINVPSKINDSSSLSSLTLRIVELESDCSNLRSELQSGNVSHAHQDALLRVELHSAMDVIQSLERDALQSKCDLQGKMDAVKEEASVMNHGRVLKHAQHYATVAINRSTDMYDCLSHEVDEDRARFVLELDGLARRVVMCNHERDSQVKVIILLTAQLRTFRVLLNISRPDRTTN